MSEELACLDGAIAPVEETTIPVTDEGFIRGDGVFEVARVYEGSVFAFDEHLDRMGRSMRSRRRPRSFSPPAARASTA